MDFRRPPRRPTVWINFVPSLRERVQWALLLIWDVIFLLVSDTATRCQPVAHFPEETGMSIMKSTILQWSLYLGPPRILESDQAARRQTSSRGKLKDCASPFGSQGVKALQAQV